MTASLVGALTPPGRTPAEEYSIMVLDSNLTVEGTPGAEVILLSDDGNTILAGGGNDTIVDYGSDNTVFMQDGDDAYLGSDGDTNFVEGGSEGDLVTGPWGRRHRRWRRRLRINRWRGRRLHRRRRRADGSEDRTRWSRG